MRSETRRLRKLVKMVSHYMHDYGLFSGGSDRRFAKALGNSSNTSSDLYPQLRECRLFVTRQHSLHG